MRLTAKFLRNTGTLSGSLPQSVWEVTAIESSIAVTNEELPLEQVRAVFTEEEIQKHPYLKFRRLAVGNLERVG